jgi:trk system potassium uptake protein TrkA
MAFHPKYRQHHRIYVNYTNTDGDNSNIVIGQMAQKHFGVGTVVVRIFDPARAAFYTGQGLNVVCPTSSAIVTLTEAVRASEGALR